MADQDNPPSAMANQDRSPASLFALAAAVVHVTPPVEDVGGEELLDNPNFSTPQLRIHCCDKDTFKNQVPSDIDAISSLPDVKLDRFVPTQISSPLPSDDIKSNFGQCTPAQAS